MWTVFQKAWHVNQNVQIGVQTVSNGTGTTTYMLPINKTRFNLYNWCKYNCYTTATVTKLDETEWVNNRPSKIIALKIQRHSCHSQEVRWR